ncbi:uncharacterized protein F5Z01DRAFT_734910 [Emericellopsis atlantica]|uniref:Uncharacterized protein n=1 Tax=Emericellopsis atlantica TaxID=2614577 RepID=A0A9P8CRJ3_9HYPO|nr:uncharacterized protein F5Z01DRAFT_734910 [Emericellopsis atlantica]KAG9256215.1 hypothetical protein F5Z01DRAFT_734910 [Emericellopsis atlantica]
MPRFQEGNTAAELAAHYAPSITGKTILTTGVTPESIGARYTEALASHAPKLLILAGRSLSKLHKQVEILTQANPDVKTRLLQVDLASIDSVTKAAAEVNSWTDVPTIDIVLNCAGIMAVPYALSVDGIEMQLAANHIGHFLLTNSIVPKLLAAKVTPRVINVSSNGHRLSAMRWGDINFDGGRTYDKWVAYGQSKTANMLFSLALAKKLGKRGLLSFSVHPGLIMTTGLATHLGWVAEGEDDAMTTLLKKDQELGNEVGFGDAWSKLVVPVSSEAGAATPMYASFDPELEAHNGTYLEKCRPSDPMKDIFRPWGRDEYEAEMLWALSEKLTGRKFDY